MAFQPNKLQKMLLAKRCLTELAGPRAARQADYEQRLRKLATIAEGLQYLLRDG